MQNVNPKTGIPYGVVGGNSVPELLELITQNGKNLTWEAFREDTISKLTSVLEDAGASDAKDTAESTFNDANWDCYQAEEEEFVYEDSHGNKFQLGYLGGASLIWIINSDLVERCNKCSPCVPGAGDLDNPNKNGTIVAYTIPSRYEIYDERDEKGIPDLAENWETND